MFFETDGKLWLASLAGVMWGVYGLAIQKLPLLDINYMKVLLNCSPAVSAFWKYIPTNPAAGCFISNNTISQVSLFTSFFSQLLCVRKKN